MAELVVNYPTGETRVFPLVLKPQDIGRDPACDICIDDTTVSRRHADIRGQGDGTFVIRDLASKNGTYLNGRPFTTSQLADGDEVMFGSVTACFRQSVSTTFISSVRLEECPVDSASESVSFTRSGAQLRLSQQRLQRLYEISSRLTALRDRQELLADIMSICIETFSFERAAIGLKQPSGKGMDWPVVHNLRGVDNEIKISRTILDKAINDGQRTIFTESDQGNFDPTLSIVQQGTRCAMCVPIAYGDEILGVLYGDCIQLSTRYEQEDVDFLAALARQLSIGLANARLMEQRQQQMLLEGELVVARQIQGGLFPETLDVHEGLRIAALNDPGRQVSGDFYDIISLGDGQVGLVIADVAGKGVAAALLAANLQAGIRLLMPERRPLVDIAGRLNRLIYQNTIRGRFITAVLAIINPVERRLTYVNAGHMPPLMVRGGMVEVLSPSANLPLGIEENFKFAAQDVDLTESGTLLVYTDGLTEALDANDNQFGVRQVVHLIEKNQGETPEKLLQQIRQEVSLFATGPALLDDITLVAVQHRLASVDVAAATPSGTNRLS